MITVAALLDSPAALAVLKRTMPGRHSRVRSCRSAARLVGMLQAEWVDAVVIGTRSRRSFDLAPMRAAFPLVPIVIYGVVRPDEGRTLLDLEAEGTAALILEGIDDPMVGELVARAGALARRRTLLADLPRLLRLTEPLQRRAFELLIGAMGPPPSTATLARRLRVSREHLSRQFGAGGAPNLKRVIDLLQLLLARDLVQNPGYPPERTALLLGYSSPSHLRAVVRRVLLLEYRDFHRATPQELIRRFLRGGARSRA